MFREVATGGDYKIRRPCSTRPDHASSPEMITGPSGDEIASPSDMQEGNSLSAHAIMSTPIVVGKGSGHLVSRIDAPRGLYPAGSGKVESYNSLFDIHASSAQCR